MFQSTPLREGRLAQSIRADVTYAVSIHAPARGATYIRPKSGPSKVSIHAPARGATIDSIAHTHSMFQSTPLREGRPFCPIHPITQSLFQSTPLREGRREYDVAICRLSEFQSTPLREGRRPVCDCTGKPIVSIHAPARGATCNACQYNTDVQFQSTPLREGRP